MGTSAVITDGTVGREHHWDSYPSGLGVELFYLYRRTFRSDVGALIKALIIDHPAGWSTIISPRRNGVDPYPSESFEAARFGSETAPSCYCHGGRSEGENNHGNGEGGGWNWIYTLLPHGLRVQGGSDDVDTIIAWDDPAPVWPSDN